MLGAQLVSHQFMFGRPTTAESPLSSHVFTQGGTYLRSQTRGAMGREMPVIKGSCNYWYGGYYSLKLGLLVGCTLKLLPLRKGSLEKRFSWDSSENYAAITSRLQIWFLFLCLFFNPASNCAWKIMLSQLLPTGPASHSSQFWTKRLTACSFELTLCPFASSFRHP